MRIKINNMENKRDTKKTLFFVHKMERDSDIENDENKTIYIMKLIEVEKQMYTMSWWLLFVSWLFIKSKIANDKTIRKGINLSDIIHAEIWMFSFPVITVQY